MFIVLINKLYFRLTYITEPKFLAKYMNDEMLFTHKKLIKLCSGSSIASALVKVTYITSVKCDIAMSTMAVVLCSLFTYHFIIH